MITLELEERDAQIVMNALAARPYLEVAEIIQTLMNQIRQQEEPFVSTPPGLDD